MLLFFRALVVMIFAFPASSFAQAKCKNSDEINKLQADLSLIWCYGKYESGEGLSKSQLANCGKVYPGLLTPEKAAIDNSAVKSLVKSVFEELISASPKIAGRAVQASVILKRGVSLASRVAKVSGWLSILEGKPVGTHSELKHQFLDYDHKNRIFLGKKTIEFIAQKTKKNQAALKDLTNICEELRALSKKTKETVQNISVKSKKVLACQGGKASKVDLKLGNGFSTQVNIANDKSLSYKIKNNPFAVSKRVNGGVTKISATKGKGRNKKKTTIDPKVTSKIGSWFKNAKTSWDIDRMIEATRISLVTDLMRAKGKSLCPKNPKK